MGRRYSTRRGRSPANAACLVEYGGLQMECRDEADAKKGLRTKTKEPPTERRPDAYYPADTRAPAGSLFGKPMRGES